MVEAAVSDSANLPSSLQKTDERVQSPFYSRGSGLSSSLLLPTRASEANRTDQRQPGLFSSRFVDVLLWLVGFALLAVTTAFVLRNRKQISGVSEAGEKIRLVATQGVRNRFQVHLLQIGDQQFLVTTDRTGVRSVNAVAFWEHADVTAETVTA